MPMKISKEDINSVIRRVMMYYMKIKNISKDCEKVLFMIPGYPIAPEKLIAEYELYDELKNMEFLLEEECRALCASDAAGILYKDKKEDIKKVFAAITSYKRLEIYAPSIDFLKSLRGGREEDVFVKIALYFLMTKKTVTVRLPYHLDTLPGGAFTKKVKDLLADLWDMGVCFGTLMPGFESLEAKADEAGSLITENRIEKCYQSGYRELTVRKGTVVTPLAWERAKELNIHISAE